MKHFDIRASEFHLFEAWKVGGSEEFNPDLSVDDDNKKQAIENQRKNAPKLVRNVMKNKLKNATELVSKDGNWFKEQAKEK